MYDNVASGLKRVAQKQITDQQYINAVIVRNDEDSMYFDVTMPDTQRTDNQVRSLKRHVDIARCGREGQLQLKNCADPKDRNLYQVLAEAPRVVFAWRHC